MEYYNNSFVDVRIYVKSVPWFQFMQQALYNTLTSNFLLGVKVLFQIIKVLLRTESKILSGPYKNYDKINSIDAENKCLGIFQGHFAKRQGH